MRLMSDHKNFSSHNIGLGKEDSEMEIFKSNHDPSSSLLPMTDLHKSAFPFATRNEVTKVKIRRLDDLMKTKTLKPGLMIKVDVQGYEQNVIRGGLETFKKANILLLELSFQELYQGQPLFEDIYDMIRPLGFEFYGNLGLMKHPKTGTPLDADCIFVKNT